MISTIFNRWSTARRFQQEEGCLLGCGEGRGSDSIEHYAVCPSVRQVASRFLNLKGQWTCGLHSMIVAHPAIKTTRDLTLTAVLTYAVYNVTNRARAQDGLQGLAYDALSQSCREAAKGCNVAERVMRNRWLSDCGEPLPDKRVVPWSQATAKLRQVRRGAGDASSSNKVVKRKRLTAVEDAPSLPAQDAEVPSVLLHVNTRVALRRHRFAFGDVSSEQARAATAAHYSAILGYDQNGNEVRC